MSTEPTYQTQTKSKYRGVYRCGKRWKAQYQSQGIQFYLGTFNTEEEAARAYETKSASYKTMGGQLKAQLAAPEEVSVNSDSKNSSTGNDDKLTGNKRSLNEIQQNDQSTFNVRCSLPQARAMWDRLCIISQRLLLSKAVLNKLLDLQIQNPDMNKETFIKSLNEEISMLSIVKGQLEESVMRYFTHEITLKSITAIESSSSNTVEEIVDSSVTLGNNVDLTATEGIGPTLYTMGLVNSLPDTNKDPIEIKDYSDDQSCALMSLASDVIANKISDEPKNTDALLSSTEQGLDNKDVAVSSLIFPVTQGSTTSSEENI